MTDRPRHDDTRRVGGRYRLLDEVGRGGMATVHRAYDEVLDRTVAIKVLHPHLAHDPAFLDRFRREARSAAALSHPNVVAVHDWGETGDGAFLVLQLVEGLSLREVLRARGQLDPGEALAVLGPIAAGLGAAHAAGLVHRDVKPENLLIGRDGTVRITDFGLARAAASATSTFGADVLVGSPHYLSPEAVRGQPLDSRADVYALGVVLFECVTGRPPHEGESPYATAVAHTSRSVPAPSTRRPGLPAPLDDVVLCATAMDRDERYDDATIFGRALVAAVPGDAAPVLVPPDVAGIGPTPESDRLDGWTAILPADDDTGHLDDEGGDDEASADDRRTAHLEDPGTDETSTTVLAAESSAGTDDADDGWDAWQAEHEWDQERTHDIYYDAPDDEDRVDDDAVVTGGRPRGRGWLVLLLVLALVGGSAATGYLLWDRVFAPVTSVPAILGADEQRAAEELERAGFDVRIEADRPHDLETPAGHVLEQDPTGSARQGSTVTVVLSAGPRQVEVSDVVGDARDDALDELRGLGLDPVTAEAHHDDVPAETVVDLDPAPGATVDEATEVTVTISLGPAPIEIPSVVELSEDAARDAVEDVGLELEVIERRHDADVPAGAVVSQDPSSGDTGVRGDTVAVVVSNGPTPLEVPAVRGMRVDEAVAELEALGLEVEVDRRGGFGALLNPDRVYDQDPGPASTLTAGDTVVLYAYE